MNFQKAIAICILLAPVFAPATFAQEQGSSGPAGQTGASTAGSSEVTSQGLEPAAVNPNPAEASDARSFQGVEEFSPGHVSAMRSYFLPSLSLTEMADTNYQVAPGHRQFATATTVVGRLTFGKIGKHTKVSADYYGGGAFYNHRSIPSTTMHQFGITGSYTGRRWSFLLDDRATYLPETGLGFAGFGFAGGLGMSLGGAYSSNLGELNSSFNPTGSLVTGRGTRILNTTVAQVQYASSARSSISVAGSYSLLHFRSPGFIDTKSATFLTSYSHQLNARDFVGVNYGFSWYQLQSSVPAFQTHFVQASYGHRISGRLAVKVGAGPLIQEFTSPLAGPSTQLSWIATSSLQVRAGRENFGVNYSHFTTGGAGVLRGASTDSVRGNWSVRLTRKWQCSLGPGYVHNRSLPQTTSGGAESALNSYYGSASLSRSFGRYTSIFFSYNYQAQRSDTVPCLTSTCESSFGRHIIGFGLNFHPRQINFD
jgi:hypothetical protein